MLLGAGLEHLVAEFPSRMLAPFDSRRFDSHPSSADLVGLWMSAAWLPARFWLGAGADAGTSDSAMSGNTGRARP